MHTFHFLDMLMNRVGYGNILFSRPEFHSLLLSKIPTNRIHYNKKVTSVEQTETHALIRCADGQTHEGDILIGADGAYSAVRTSIYNELKKDNKLPANDIQEMNVGYACIVGTTTALSTEKYPCLKDETSNFAVCIADGKPHSVRFSFSFFFFAWTSTTNAWA